MDIIITCLIFYIDMDNQSPEIRCSSNILEHIKVNSHKDSVKNELFSNKLYGIMYVEVL